jgi:hypothetical protein
VIVRPGLSRPNSAGFAVCSTTTSSASSFSRLVRIDSTAEVSAGAVKGDVTFQPAPSLTRRIVSPPAAAREISFALALSTARTVTFARSPSGLGSCFLSTNQM